MSRTSWSLLFSSFKCWKIVFLCHSLMAKNCRIFMFFSICLWQFTPSLLWIHVKYALTPLVSAVWTEASICQTPKHLNYRALEDHHHGNSWFLWMSHPWLPQNVSHHQHSKPGSRGVQHDLASSLQYLLQCLLSLLIGDLIYLLWWSFLKINCILCILKMHVITHFSSITVGFFTYKHKRRRERKRGRERENVRERWNIKLATLSTSPSYKWIRLPGYLQENMMWIYMVVLNTYFTTCTHETLLCLWMIDIILRNITTQTARINQRRVERSESGFICLLWALLMETYLSPSSGHLLALQLSL